MAETSAYIDKEQWKVTYPWLKNREKPSKASSGERSLR
jgi:hypothetical protein